MDKSLVTDALPFTCKSPSRIKSFALITPVLSPVPPTVRLHSAIRSP